jgi:hypothetical protein
MFFCSAGNTKPDESFPSGLHHKVPERAFGVAARVDRLQAFEEVSWQAMERMPSLWYESRVPQAALQKRFSLLKQGIASTRMDQLCSLFAPKSKGM